MSLILVFPVIVISVPLNSITLLYPLLTVKSATETSFAIVQLPSPFPSKNTLSSASGTEAPAVPPLVADQFIGLFQFSSVFEIQYLGPGVLTIFFIVTVCIIFSSNPAPSGLDKVISIVSSTSVASSSRICISMLALVLSAKMVNVLSDKI